MAAEAQHLHGLVDMGSNGIRFSITDLSPPRERLLSTVWQDRAGISLYDAQYTPGNSQRQPIPDSIIQSVIKHLLRFKSVCRDFGVPDGNVNILATEATRTAINSSSFLDQMYGATGWAVNLLSKEDEGHIGARGVQSSLGSVSGLVMDLGGGSTQLTWISADGEIAPSAVSIPYGAAALTRRLAEAQSVGSEATSDLALEIREAISRAYRTLKPRSDFDNLYLSGGGFRGWGFILLSQHPIQPYPISTINGFSAPREAFLDTSSVRSAGVSQDIHRVSARRAAQVPAVAFLVEQLAYVISGIKQVHFCQGGVREGWFFSQLPREKMLLHPLTAAVGPASYEIVDLLSHAISPLDTEGPAPFDDHIVEALAVAMYLHASVSVDSRAQTALRYSTTGALAGVHGLSHFDRAALAILLVERHGGREALPQHERHFFDMLSGLLTESERWWARYLGRIAALVGVVCPFSLNTRPRRLYISNDYPEDESTPDLYLEIHKDWIDLTKDEVDGLRKLSKKKHWPANWGLDLTVYDSELTR